MAQDAETAWWSQNWVQKWDGTIPKNDQSRIWVIFFWPQISIYHFPYFFHLFFHDFDLNDFPKNGDIPSIRCWHCQVTSFRFWLSAEPPVAITAPRVVARSGIHVVDFEDPNDRVVGSFNHVEPVESL